MKSHTQSACMYINLHVLTNASRICSCYKELRKKNYPKIQYINNLKKYFLMKTFLFIS